VGIEINNASAGANEIAILIFTVASYPDFVRIKKDAPLRRTTSTPATTRAPCEAGFRSGDRGSRDQSIIGIAQDGLDRAIHVLLGTSHAKEETKG
jgi:hypothetical protein